MNISETNSTLFANPEPPVIYVVSCVINLILSVPTNGYVLWLIVNRAGGMMTSEFFSLNLAVSEILYCLFSLFVIFNGQTQTTLFFSLGNFGISFLFTGRPLFQSCVCVERYLAVVHPVTFLKYKPLRYRVGCCAAAWMLVLGAGVCSMLLTKNNGSRVSLYNCIYLVQYFILTSVKFFCGISVLRALNMPGPGEGDREGAKNMKMKAFKIILIILVYTLVSNLPLIFISSLMYFVEPLSQYFASCVSFSIIVISGFLQPLYYIQMAGKLPCIRAL